MSALKNRFNLINVQGIVSLRIGSNSASKGKAGGAISASGNLSSSGQKVYLDPVRARSTAIEMP